MGGGGIWFVFQYKANLQKLIDKIAVEAYNNISGWYENSDIMGACLRLTIFVASVTYIRP